MILVKSFPTKNLCYHLLNLLLTNKQKDNIIVNVNKQNQHMRY